MNLMLHMPKFTKSTAQIQIMLNRNTVLTTQLMKVRATNAPAPIIARLRIYKVGATVLVRK